MILSPSSLQQNACNCRPNPIVIAAEDRGSNRRHRRRSDCGPGSAEYRGTIRVAATRAVKSQNGAPTCDWPMRNSTNSGAVRQRLSPTSFSLDIHLSGMDDYGMRYISPGRAVQNDANSRANGMGENAVADSRKRCAAWTE